MAVFRVVVVPWTVQICGHRADEIAAVLVAISVAHFQACDLGNGIGLIGGFQRSSQQRIFIHGLRCVFGVNA